jgi:MATE family multidrug resistance protein
MRTYLHYYHQILSLGLPIIVSQAGMIVVGFADNMMVAYYDAHALAAAAFVNNLFGMAILGCIGFTYGITPLVGALFGSGRHEEIGRTMHTAVRLNMLYALLITAVMTVLYLNLESLGQQPELLPLIRPYYKLYIAGIIPVSLYNVFAQWSYGIKNTRMPMWVILLSNGLNVVGNYLLIFGHLGLPRLGLTGAGISTLITRWLCPLIVVGYFMLRADCAVYRRGYRQARVSLRAMWSLLKASLPVSLQLMFETGSFSIAAVMAGWIGWVEPAAFQVMVTLGTLGFCLYYALGSATSVLIANAAGEGNRRAMRSIGWAGYHMTLLMALVAMAVFTLAGPQIIDFFADHHPQVVAMAVSLIPAMCLYQVADATQVNFANALRGTSHVMPMLGIAFFSYMVVGVPSTYLMGFTLGWGIQGIFLSFSVSLLTAAALFLYFFLRHSNESTKQ